MPKPEKQNPDHVRCPECLKPYGFVNCRVSRWDKEGKRYERCLDCGAAAERKKAQEES